MNAITNIIAPPSHIRGRLNGRSQPDLCRQRDKWVADQARAQIHPVLVAEALGISERSVRGAAIREGVSFSSQTRKIGKHYILRKMGLTLGTVGKTIILMPEQAKARLVKLAVARKCTILQVLADEFAASVERGEA